MSSRSFQDDLETTKMFTKKESLSLSNKSKSVSHKYISNKSIFYKFKANPRQTQDALIRTQ